MFSCTRSFTKCDDLYSEILIEFRSITIIFVWGEYITYLSVDSTWVKEFIVYQKLLISKKFKYWWVHNNVARVWGFCL